MVVITNLEFRKFEESAYDFLDSNGKRQSGVSKAYLFMTEEEEVIKVGLPKDVNICVEMKRGQLYDVKLDAKIKPVVDKNNNVSQKQFYVYFQLLEVLTNPFDVKSSSDQKVVNEVKK